MESYENMEVLDPALLRVTLEALDDDYEDVTLTIEEQVKKALKNPLAMGMSQVGGLGPDKIQQIFAFSGMAKSGDLVYC